MANGICKGCYRTLDEIVKWRDFSDDDKIIVLKEIEERKSQT